MPYDAIERWEWEGGAIAADASVPEEIELDDGPEWPVEADIHEKGAHQPSSSSISSRRPPGATARR